MNVEAIQVDLPYGTMHLMGMLRIVDRDLAIGWPLRLPHRAVDLPRAHGFRIAWIPDEREARECFALNMVTLGPRKVLMAGTDRLRSASRTVTRSRRAGRRWQRDFLQNDRRMTTRTASR